MPSPPSALANRPQPSSWISSSHPLRTTDGEIYPPSPEQQEQPDLRGQQEQEREAAQTNSNPSGSSQHDKQQEQQEQQRQQQEQQHHQQEEQHHNLDKRDHIPQSPNLRNSANVNDDDINQAKTSSRGRKPPPLALIPLSTGSDLVQRYSTKASALSNRFRRNSSRLPSLLARLSSVAATGGAIIAVSKRRTQPSCARPGGTEREPRDNPNPWVLTSPILTQVVSQSHKPSFSSPSNVDDSLESPGNSDLSSVQQSFRSAASSLNPTSPVQPSSTPLESNTVQSNKMHQTSSRLLRMTEDERPFTRDFKDLFSTLMVSLPLTPHRVRFQKIEHTFTSEEAVTNLGSLKFSQSNRMPDPKDPSRIVTTTTTTTFSMAKEMARSVCQKFLEARFIESVDGKNDFAAKSAVWQLTPKGMHILQRFCNRNGINQRHVQVLLDSPRNTMHLVLLEREPEGDKIHRDQATMEVVFRRFVGQDGPNLKWSTANSDSDSLSDYQTGLVGVKMARERKIGDKTYWNTFTGKAAVDWLMDCCTMVDKRETVELASLFCEYDLISPVDGQAQKGGFSPAKTAIYYVTDKGQRVAGWVPSPKIQNGDDSATTSAPPRRIEGTSRDSNANKMTVIIRDPALRLLFREFLRDTHCEENLAFYLDVREFLASYTAAKRVMSTLRLDTIRETLAAAYSLYNAFLAPGSPCELNIDHSLRTALAGRMTRAVGDDEATIASLDEVASLFDQAQSSVFKLMASDSVPKFMREAKYASILRERNLDATLGGPSATQSRMA